MNVPNRYHHSKKAQKPRLKPQAMRARKAALKALRGSSSVIPKLAPYRALFFSLPLWVCSLIWSSLYASECHYYPATNTAGAGLDMTEQNALTVAAVATGVTTLGGAAFVATAVALLLLVAPLPLVLLPLVVTSSPPLAPTFLS